MAELLSITPKTKDLGGFKVRRALPDIKKRSIGPFVFFDHMGPAIFPPGKGIDVRPHPHIGLATLTYLFEGEFRHQDSLGTDQMIYPDEVNWMIAGKGITHSERTSPDTRQAQHTMHGLQAWVALPKEFEQIDPDFQHVKSNDLPKWQVDGASFCLVLGDWNGKTTPVTTFSPMHYLVIDIEPNNSIHLSSAPNGHESGIYVVSGAITIDEQTFDAGTMMILPEKKPLTILSGDTQTKLARIGGKNLGYRHLWWNFVATDKKLIETAKISYTKGEMRLPPCDNNEWILLPN